MTCPNGTTRYTTAFPPSNENPLPQPHFFRLMHLMRHKPLHLCCSLHTVCLTRDGATMHVQQNDACDTLIQKVVRAMMNCML